MKVCSGQGKKRFSELFGENFSPVREDRCKL